MKKRAYAKVNLALDVIGRRENGYHDVKMIMQNLDIYDELEFAIEDVREGKGYEIEIQADHPDIPTDEGNLIYKAAKLLCEEFGITKRIKVKLIKNIPVEAGMAGGSTDAAATLHAVNELCGLGLSTKQLMEYGVKLGADVPYCVLGKTALSEGIGEILTEIDALPECYVAVAKPPVGVSTKLIYTELDSRPIDKHPKVDEMVEALKNQDIQAVAGLMENVLESVTAPMHPEISEIEKIMLHNGALNAIMSGSGPTVFGIYEDEAKAKKAISDIENAGLAKQTFVTVPMTCV